MTTGVIFHAESPIKSLYGDVQGWRNLISKMNVDYYIVIDKEGIIPNWEDKVIKSYRVNNIQEAIALVPIDDEVIVFSNTGKKYTATAGNKCFVFGSDSGKLDLTDTYSLGEHELFAMNCASIVLYLQDNL
jgi:MinD superfamily P-loop ATPase